MRRFGLISLVAAALLFVGCGEKKEETTSHNVASSVSSAVSSVKREAQLPGVPPKTEQKVKKTTLTEQLPGTPAPKPEKTQGVTKAQQTVSEVKERVESAASSIAQQAQQKGSETLKAAATAAGAAQTAETAAKAAPSVDGAKLYAKCASCHGPKGERKALGKSAIIAGMPKDEVLKKLKGYKEGSLNLYGMGALMKTQVAGLSEADLEALADYISKLK